MLRSFFDHVTPDGSAQLADPGDASRPLRDLGLAVLSPASRQPNKSVARRSRIPLKEMEDPRFLR
jgi:hypothetical protein